MQARYVAIFKTNLDHERVSRGLTKTGFAKLAGVPRETMQHYLSGRIEPGAFNLCLIANALGITIDSLFTERDDDEDG